MHQWIQDGADPSRIQVPKLKEDLFSLLKGRSIKYPLGDKIVSSADYIILEKPSGRERQEIREYIDLVVYIDVPQDVCVTRLIQRVLDMVAWDAKGTFAGESKEDLVRQLDAAAMWIDHYQKTRAVYMSGSSAVKQIADILIDGMKSVNEITSEILNAIREKFGDPIKI
jgi:uridine kinase